RRARDEAQATLVVGSVGTWRWDLEHNVAEVGDSYRRLLGLPDAGDQISAERFFKVLHPDDQPRLASYIERILVERRPVDIEYRIRYPGGKEDGDVRWLLSRGGPVVDVAGTVTDILGASVDITARKDAEATIQRQARLIDLSYEPIFVRGEDDGIVEWNRGAEQLYGYTRDDAIGKRSHDLLQTIHPMPIAAVLAALDRDGAWTGEPRHMAKDGRVVVVESRQQAIDIDGRRLILETNRDITERIRAEYERQTILDSLTHDLKNPLTAMLGQTQLLQRQITRQGLPDAASLTARLAEFEEQATWMNELIEELSDHARLTAGQPVELTIESTDLVALVRDVVAKFPATTGPHAIRFDPEDSAMVGDWDQRRLRRVVANLLGNALKYSPAGGEILVRLIRFKATAVLEVRDEGIGIPAADLPYVFDVRRRGGNVGTITGSGVGLAGAKQIVEQHRGTITAESQAGAGSTFTVTLPLSAQDAT
ncbi:MAG: PAS domain-containing sensor histidine kinase, partial [Chloroflexia bacterium]|nr:PAS domain-containing sensor histidine kinase [Chloroflexia bacterium]